ncbi:MAG: hypothetical protein ACTIOL_02620 [Enterococcus sp.]
MNINLKDLGLMSFPAASVRWNKEKTYVFQQYKKYPHKFLEGSTAEVGNGKKNFYIITREGMEHLMKQTEKEADKGMWLVRRQENWVVNFEQRVDSELEARNLITEKIASETNESRFKVSFDQYQTNPIKTRVVLKGNVIYTYEKNKKK